MQADDDPRLAEINALRAEAERLASLGDMRGAALCDAKASRLVREMKREAGNAL